MALEPNAQLGPYQIAGLIGEGGMGAVYRARDTRLGRDVAIKVLTNVMDGDRDRLLRFEQEARATGMLNHPNLLTIYDVGRDEDGAPFLVSELLEGETLSRRLERGPLSPRKAVEAALQMAHGLAAAHEKGIVHRDLKPDNLFLTRDGRLKILDFGIAKLSPLSSGEGPTFQMAATEPGMVLGTVGYMSPEQVRGESVDARSDLFSLGAIFYEMLSGLRAFKRNSAIETLSAILREEPPDLTEMLPNLPAAVERLVRRCLEKDRDQRFQSARDLAFNLETLSTMSQANSLSGVPSARTAPHTGSLPTAKSVATTAPQLPSQTHASAATQSAASSAATARTAAQPTARPATSTTRLVSKPKRRAASPLLLGLLYLVSIGGAAYGGWMFAHRETAAVQDPEFHRVTFRRGEVRSARFTPDGDTIVYSAAWDGQPSEVFVASRGATDARPLGIPDSEVLAVSKSAELAILLHRDRITSLGTLARVPLAGGMPRELADDVLQADWSPDGANLAIIRFKDGKSRIEYPIGTVRYETPHYVREVRVAPDGKRLAILEPMRGEFDVAVIDQGNPVTIARGWARGATGIAWSPDGSELYVSGTPSSAPPALYAVNMDGATRLVSKVPGSVRIFDISARHELLLSNGTWRATLVWKPGADQPEVDASWLDWSAIADLSADGKTLLFSETREGGGANSAVYLRRFGAPAPVRLGDGIGDALSPDGKWVLVHDGAKLALFPTGAGEPRQLKIDGSFEFGAAWLPDSRRAVVGGLIGKGSYRLYVIDTLDETATPLSPEGIWSGGTRAYAVSPDGRYVAAMNANELATIYAIDGKPATPVVGVEKGEIPIQWSADGASLLVYRPTSLPAQVYRVTLATGTRELWKEFAPADRAGVYKIAPVAVTPDSNGYAYNGMRMLSDLYVLSAPGAHSESSAPPR
ncbi:MAG: protein kinase [Acidobacteria bacterium]|nr:protein kinase [Acidobacteriota bacterium]MBV9476050.1 protein kinase [Acidobacteriota bacterium]